MGLISLTLGLFEQVATRGGQSAINSHTAWLHQSYLLQIAGYHRDGNEIRTARFVFSALIRAQKQLSLYLALSLGNKSKLFYF